MSFLSSVFFRFDFFFSGFEIWYYSEVSLYLISQGWVILSFLHPSSWLTVHLATLAAVSRFSPSVKGFGCALCWSQTHYLPLPCLYAIVLYANVYVRISTCAGFHCADRGGKNAQGGEGKGSLPVSPGSWGGPDSRTITFNEEHMDVYCVIHLLLLRPSQSPDTLLYIL